MLPIILFVISSYNTCYLAILTVTADCVVGGMTDIIVSGTLLGFYSSHASVDDDL